MATSWWREPETLLLNTQYEAAPNARQELSGMELIGVYFGVYNSRPARHITKWIRKFHEDCKTRQKKFEIVFCSMDEEEKDCINFVSNLHGDWYVIPWDNQKLRRNVRMMYNVLIQPAFVIVKNNSEGSVVSYNAKNEIFIYGSGSYDIWIEKSKSILTESERESLLLNENVAP